MNVLFNGEGNIADGAGPVFGKRNVSIRKSILGWSIDIE